MADALVVNGRLRAPLVLPLKSRRANSVTKRQLPQDDEQMFSLPKRPMPSSRSAALTTSPNMLTIKKQAHRFYQRQQRHPLSKQVVPSGIRDGPQLDPFDSFPIASTPDVPKMAQYYVQVWAPEHGCAFGMDGHPNPYLSILWPYAMQHDIYFEAIVALCLATWLPSQGVETREDRLFLHHRGNVVAKLRARLASPKECADDCTTLTVATLGTIDYVLGAHETAVAHVEGMRRIMQLRGGLQDSSPFQRLLEVNVKAFEDLWSFVTECKSPTEEQPNPTSMLKQGALPTYMAHPFKPEVCTMMAKLPRGFCDIGLKGTLSLQMIKILTSLNESPTESALPTAATAHAYPLTPESLTSPVPVSSSHTLPYIREVLQDLHRLATMRTTMTEHILCYGLIAYCYTLRHVYFFDSFGTFYTSVVDVLTQKCLRHNPEVENLDRKCYLWCSVVVATTLMNISYSGTSKYIIFEHLISKYPEIRQWMSLSKLMSEFFWVDKLEEMVKKSWQEAKQWLMLPEEERRGELKKAKGMSIRDVIV